MRILVTGGAGFIGMHVSKCLLDRGDEVICVDNLSNYYDVQLKKNRLANLSSYPKFSHHKLDISDKDSVLEIFDQLRPNRVVHLAAQAGVRYSLQNPHAYTQANIDGFLNILEGCRRGDVDHLVYASSSSVYGTNESLPFSEIQNVDHPVSLYAATKKANELMAHSYSHLFKIPTTGLRFFTAYGPWGRPDMALFLFTKAILANEEIELFNGGQMSRDFTYIDDIVEAVVRVLDRPATPDLIFDRIDSNPATSAAPYRIFNVGNSNPTPLLVYLNALESALGITSKKKYLPLQAGDVPNTASDTSRLNEWIGFKPRTTVQDGVEKFVRWYRGYYGV